MSYLQGIHLRPQVLHKEVLLAPPRPPVKARLNKLVTKCSVVSVTNSLREKKKIPGYGLIFVILSASASTPMGDSRRRTLRQNIFVAKPPQGRTPSLLLPQNSTLVYSS